MRPKSVTRSHLVPLACLVFLYLFRFRLSNAGDTLTAGEVLKDGAFLKSENKMFQLQFFDPSYPSYRYLGIQFMGFGMGKKIIWVANRENPLYDTSGYLSITDDGYLVIRDEGRNSIVINSGEPMKRSNTSLTLLDSGNLVMKAGQLVVWQSFDHPTDTILPGMKFGLFDLKLRQPHKRFLTSWVGPGAPAEGAFTLGVNPNNSKQLIVWRRGVPYWRSESWNGSIPFQRAFNDGRLNFSYTANENESYFTYSQTLKKFSWIEMNSTGHIHIFFGDIGLTMLEYRTICDEKNSGDDGCIMQMPSKCSSGDEFVRVVGIMEWWEYEQNSSLGLSDCEEACRNKCSCTAYGSASSDGSGCKFTNESVVDQSIKEFDPIFYFRNTTAKNDTRAAPTQPINNITAPTALPVDKESPMNKKKWVIIVSPLVSLSLLTLIWSLCYLIWKKCFSEGKKGSSRDQVGRDTEQFIHELGSSIAAIDESTAHELMLRGKMDHELPMFSFSTIETATEHFSEANKLGQGGFGPVFKGKLVNGQEIAVKRLSARSGQGVEEFTNEVVLISKVQHRNLVRLFGCCIKGEEKLLVYEYLPNKSLDTFIFDEMKRLLLDWRMRMNIIEGVAQGLLYLHKYSRLKIIHRDLKTSNILLDNNMNPKISDFGTAKIFGENESRANTNRIVGTYGYMSPEYAMDGLFSVKSDVFSFGVMMLEIISGKKATGFYQSNHSSNLVQYAWNLWKEGRSSDLVDQPVEETCSTSELERCVQVALLCVQENAVDRPTMSDVVSMLISSDADILPEPTQSSVSTLLEINNKKFPNSPNFGSTNDVTTSNEDTR